MVHVTRAYRAMSLTFLGIRKEHDMGKEHEKTGPRTEPGPADKKSNSGDTKGYPEENPGRQGPQAGKAIKESETGRAKRTQGEGLS